VKKEKINKNNSAKKEAGLASFILEISVFNLF